MFRGEDINWLSAAAAEIYSARSVGEFSANALAALSRRFDAPVLSCEELSSSGSTYTAHGLVLNASVPLDYEAFIHDHPIMPLLPRMPRIMHLRGRGQTVQWEKTNCFNGIARQMGYNDQIIMRAQNAPSVALVSVYRDNLSPCDAALLELWQPHLAMVWSRVAPTRSQLVDHTASTIQFSSIDRAVNFHDSSARLLKIYFPSWREASSVLPKPLADWTRWVQQKLRHDIHTIPLLAFQVDALRGRLFVRYFPGKARDSFELRLIEHRNQRDPAEGRDCLTAREREVFYWIAEGKRDTEIATILAITKHIASKHVARILSKLQLDSRSAVAGLKLSR